MTDDFWERCVDAGCVVVPIKVYSGYVGGDIHPSTYVGIRYVAMEFSDVAIGPDYWTMIDEAVDGEENFHASPLEALQAFKKRS